MRTTHTVFHNFLISINSQVWSINISCCALFPCGCYESDHNSSRSAHAMESSLISSGILVRRCFTKVTVPLRNIICSNMCPLQQKNRPIIRPLSERMLLEPLPAIPVLPPPTAVHQADNADFMDSPRRMPPLQSDYIPNMH
jgi:hypothetical protein